MVVVWTVSLARDVAVPAEFIAVHWYHPASDGINRSNLRVTRLPSTSMWYGLSSPGGASCWPSLLQSTDGAGTPITSADSDTAAPSAAVRAASRSTKCGAVWSWRAETNISSAIIESRLCPWWTIHDEYSAVIVQQNLVTIYAVVSAVTPSQSRNMAQSGHDVLKATLN